MAKHLTLDELTLALGRSRRQISNDVKAGMPKDSAESARLWLATHGKEGRGHKTKDASMLAAAESLLSFRAPSDPSAPANEDDPETAIYHARLAEKMSFDEMSSAIGKAKEARAKAEAPDAVREDKINYAEAIAVLQPLHRSLGAAIRNRIDAEKTWARHLEKTGSMIPIAVAKDVIARTVGPLAAQLHQLARMAAPAANPTDPAMAERAIAQFLDPMLNQIADELAKET